MSLDTRIVVISCPRRASLQQIWKTCQERNWPDCPLPITVLSPDPDVGWNRNLITLLDTISETYILQMLDDNFIEPMAPGEITANIVSLIELMNAHPDIALVKVQAGGAHAPEIEFPAWERIREYDRGHHPFKRTNLIPALYRRTWLHRLSSTVLSSIGPERDIGRNGAIEFEMLGTALTSDAREWPERMMGIHRPLPDGGGGQSLLECYGNDAVTGGKLRPFLHHLAEGVPGMETYL